MTVVSTPMIGGDLRHKRTGKPKIAPVDLQKIRTMRRMEGLRAVLQKVIRVLTRSGVNLALADSRDPSLHDVPGWTNGADVTINRSIIEGLLDGVLYSDPRFGEVVMSFKGVVYHETGHILFSPRMQSRICQAVRDLGQHQDPRYWYAFNGLEDQRMEMLFTGRYGPTTPYFNALVSEWLVKTPEALVVSHALLWGRRYLPDSIRLAARQVFEAHYSVDLAKQFANVIDEYLGYVFDDSVVTERKALECVKKYKLLLDQLNRNTLPPQPSMDNTPDESGSEPNTDGENALTKGKPDKKKQQEAQKGDRKREKERQNERRKQPEDQDGTPAAGDQGTEDHDPGQGESEGDTDADTPDQEGMGEGDDATQEGGQEPGDGSDLGDEAGDSDGDEAEGDAEGEGEGTGDGEGDDADGDSDGDGGDGTSGDGDGDANGEGEDGDSDGDGWGGDGDSDSDSSGFGANDAAATANDLFDAAREAIENIHADEAIQQQTQATIDAVRVTVQGDDGLGGMECPSQPIPPSSEARTVVRRIQRDLASLRLDQDPVKEHRHTSGRINMRRVMSSDETDIDLFDQWNTELEEAGGVEVVILLDLSGSMQSVMELISQMMWSIKTSFDRLDIPCTVIGYANSWNVLYRPNQKAQRNTVSLFHQMGGTTPLYAIREAHRILTTSQHANRILVSITDGQWFPQDRQGTAWLYSDDSRVVDAEVEPYMADMHWSKTTSMLIGIINGDPTMVDYPVKKYGLHHHEMGFDTNDLSSIPMAVGKLVRRVLYKVNQSHQH